MGEDPCIRTLALTLSHKNNKELQKGLGNLNERHTQERKIC